MAKEESIRVEGEVVDILPNATFRVKIENFEKTVIGVISGKMRQFNIKVLVVLFLIVRFITQLNLATTLNKDIINLLHSKDRSNLSMLKVRRRRPSRHSRHSSMVKDILRTQMIFIH